jgi:hypothetical protein
MGRRHITTSKEIYRLRGVYWARYYRYREFAKCCGVDGVRVLNALVKAGLPEPEVQVDGSIYEPLDVISAKHKALEVLGLRYSFADARDAEISITWLDLMCPFFWTENGWMSYVRLYESLPDPVEDHYLLYDAERDGGRLVPMSSKPKKGVDKSVGKSSVSQVQSRLSMYKSHALVGSRVVNE